MRWYNNTNLVHSIMEATIKYYLGASQLGLGSIWTYFLGNAIWRSEYIGGFSFSPLLLGIHLLLAIITYFILMALRFKKRESLSYAYSSSLGKKIMN